MTEIQKITLRDILTTAGLTPRQVEDVFLLLRFKPERVQMAFYYRACGNTYEEIGGFMDIPERTAHNYVNINCSDVGQYIKNLPE